MTFAQCIEFKQSNLRFLIKLSLAFANEVKHLIKDPKSLKALELTEKWYNDTNSVTIQELRDAVDAAHNAAHYAAHNAAYDAAYYAASALNKDEKWKLEVLKSCMSKFEREMFDL